MFQIDSKLTILHHFKFKKEIMQPSFSYHGLSQNIFDALIITSGKLDQQSSLKKLKVLIFWEFKASSCGTKLYIDRSRIMFFSTSNGYIGTVNRIFLSNRFFKINCKKRAQNLRKATIAINGTLDGRSLLHMALWKKKVKNHQ